VLATNAGLPRRHPVAVLIVISECATRSGVGIVASRLSIGTVAGLVLITALAGCATTVAAGGNSASGSPGAPPPNDGTSAPALVEVLCDADLSVSVSSDTVAATSSGVALRVTSEAPAGAYLNYGLGGDPMPATPETWMLAAPPGELHLWCSTLDHEGAEVAVTVVDPDHHWSDRTLADFGCPIGGMPYWVVSAGTGATPEEAVTNLIAKFTASGVSPTLTRSEHAEIGYPDASNQTWIIGTADTTYMTAVVAQSGSNYTANPDALCVASPWTTAPDA